MTETSEEIWHFKDVRREYARAFAVLSDTVPRGGPKKYGTAWPDVHDPVDAWLAYASSDNFDEQKVRVPRSAKEISRMNIVMIGYQHPRTKNQIKGWFSEFLPQRWGLRQCLNIYALSELKNLSEKMLSNRQGIAYSTYRKRRDDAAIIIAGNLNRLAIPMF